MNTFASEGVSEPPGRNLVYRYRFENVEFDALHRELRVDGVARVAEPRALELLATLLRDGTALHDDTLTSTVQILRQALGPQAAARLVHAQGTGCRLEVPVERAAIEPGTPAQQPPPLHAGQAVFAGQGFVLDRPLDADQRPGVWLARHTVNGSQRLFKLATDAPGLPALEREAALCDTLAAALGRRADLPHVLARNFAQVPYFLAFEPFGESLSTWAQRPDTLAILPRAARIDLFQRIAEAVAAAHSVGVLHKGLRPSRISLRYEGGVWQPRVDDFGVEALLHDTAAPEVLGGQAPTVRSDVYALGLLLLGLVCGDLRTRLAADWPQMVDDDLLAEDIRQATQADPAHRTPSVSALIDRLAHLESRRVQRRAEQAQSLELARSARELGRARARTPWLVATAFSLAAGAGISLWLYRSEASARQAAVEAQQRADRVNDFLVDDVLGRVGPNEPGALQDTAISEVLDRAGSAVHERFAGDPLTSARVHRMLGNAYDGMTRYAQAEAHKRSAIEQLTRAYGPDHPRTLIARYRLISLLLRAGQAQSAQQWLQETDALAGERRLEATELGYSAHQAQGSFLVTQGDARGALPHFERAEQIRPEVLPDDTEQLFLSRTRLSYCFARLGRGEDALRAVADLMRPEYGAQQVALRLRARVYYNHAAALNLVGRYADSVQFIQTALLDLPADVAAYQPMRASLQGFLGEAYQGLRDWPQARGALERTLTLAQQAHGADSVQAHLARGNLGRLLWRLGQLDAALGHLQASHDGLQAQGSAGAADTQAVRYHYAWALIEAQQPARARDLAEDLNLTLLTSATPDPLWAPKIEVLQAASKLGAGSKAAVLTRARETLAALARAGAPAEDVKLYRRAMRQAEPALNSADFGAQRADQEGASSSGAAVSSRIG